MELTMREGSVVVEGVVEGAIDLTSAGLCHAWWSGKRVCKHN